MMARASAPALAGNPRVNLLPRAEVMRREASGLVRRWLLAVCAAVVVAAVVCAGAFALRATTEQRVATARAETTALLGELASLADVSKAVRTVAALETFRAAAMTSDMDWSPLLGRLASVLPAGAAIVGFEVTTGGSPVGDPAEGIGLTGTLTLVSPSPMEMAPVIRSLRSLTGVQFVDAREVTSDPESGQSLAPPPFYTYVVAVDIDQTAYSGAFAQQGNE